MELHVGDITDAAEPRGRGEGRRGRLLPRPRDGRRRRVRRARAAAARRTSPGWRSAKGSSGSSTSAGLGDESVSEHLRSRHETARRARRRGAAADLLPGGDGGRRRQRVLPDAALPGRAAAGDDRARAGCGRRPSRSASTRRSSTCAALPRSPSRQGARSRSAAPTCSPTRRCWTGWRWRWASGRGASSRSLHHAVAVVALARPGDAGRHQGGAAAGRGPDHGDGRHRPLRCRAVRDLHPSRSTRRCGAPGRRNGRPAPESSGALEDDDRDLALGLLLVFVVGGPLGGHRRPDLRLLLGARRAGAGLEDVAFDLDLDLGVLGEVQVPGGVRVVAAFGGDDRVGVLAVRARRSTASCAARPTCARSSSAAGSACPATHGPPRRRWPCSDRRVAGRRASPPMLRRGNIRRMSVVGRA